MPSEQFEVLSDLGSYSKICTSATFVLWPNKTKALANAEARFGAGGGRLRESSGRVPTIQAKLLGSDLTILDADSLYLLGGLRNHLFN